MALIDDCRRELRIVTTTLDEDIKFHIRGGIQELERMGVPSAVVSDPGNDLVTKAIRTYVRAHMGHEDAMEKMLQSFDSQADAIRKSVWEVDDV